MDEAVVRHSLLRLASWCIEQAGEGLSVCPNGHMESNQRGGVKIFSLEEHIRILCEFGKELGLGIYMKSNAEMWGVGLQHGDPSSAWLFQSGNSGRGVLLCRGTKGLGGTVVSGRNCGLKR